MSAPKVGDRVRVVLEGTVATVGEGGFTTNRSIDGLSYFIGADDPAVSVEVLRPPVKVGDVIDTAEELDALPDRAVVLNDKGCAMQTDGTDWYAANGHSGPVSKRPRPATVLYLPDGAA
jgi:hypothetical protein